MNISFVDDTKLQIEWKWYEQLLALNFRKTIN